MIEEKRKTRRVDINSVRAKISRDKKTWCDADILENSASGLSLSTSESSFEVGEFVFIDYEILDVKGTILNGKINTKGEILWKVKIDSSYKHGVKFENVESDIGHVVFYVTKNF
jgi:hypothetical protein